MRAANPNSGEDPFPCFRNTDEPLTKEEEQNARFLISILFPERFESEVMHVSSGWNSF